MGTSRRLFLKSSVAASGGLLAGCLGGGTLPSGGSLTPGDDDDATANDDDDTVANDDDSAGDDDDTADDDDDSAVDIPDPACEDAYAAGLFLEVLVFENDATSDANLEVPLGSGHDARLFTDLRELDEGMLVNDIDEFYVRTEFPDLLTSTDGWVLRIRGLVDEFDLTLEELMGFEEDLGTHLLECSGNGAGGNMGLLSSCEWSGIPWSRILEQLSPEAGATRVLISGFDDRTQESSHSDPGASWIFTFAELEAYGAFFATGMNGQPLSDDHGFPVRLFVPRWYGCSCIKWVDEIRFVDENEPSTSQMREFASRTHQNGTPTLAREFLPASMDTAAMPVRVEKWELAGEIVYRVLGIIWGGDELQPAVSIRFGADDWQEVHFCPDREHVATWGLWWTTWVPTSTGQYALNCRVDDPSIQTRRLNNGGPLRYERTVIVDEVGAP